MIETRFIAAQNNLNASKIYRVIRFHMTKIAKYNHLSIECMTW